ncbi:alpha-hydroxy-acid oxidizing protein, partial [Streptomyces sp. PSKA30]|uniref:alpha-hydroxy-acid oxidizing protein n=1 Tax=Streptomyces sp. PSKA30 TaxID=2874597 RepID=UPI001CD0D26E|nr:alpha-hydroxy-acid oxidizing protein [Streptomyces sp. PSKA30]
MAGWSLDDHERASAENRAAFDRTGLRPGRFTRPGPPDTTTKILDRPWAAPIAVGRLAGLADPP